MPRKTSKLRAEICHTEIQEAYADMLIRLAMAAEYKDASTGGHIRRVSDYAVAIAEALDLSAEETDVIRYASMMHDIGKIGVPDAILDKNGALTAEERKIMNRHTAIGGRIFAGSKFPMVKAAGEIALTHHERYDGTGYPQGLKGKQIPLYGRIVTIADWFDALVSKRSYKPAYSFDAAIKGIEERSGTFFEPKIVKIFLGIKPTLRKLLRANRAIESAVA